MAKVFKSFMARRKSSTSSGFLFPKTDPKIDGEECLHDCEDCSIQLPDSFKIDEVDYLYGHIKGWATHLIVSTGKTDWVRDVADEKGSVMEAVGKGTTQPENGRLMLSASNMPADNERNIHTNSTTVLLLPAFTFIDNVTPESVPSLIQNHVNPAPTNTTPLPHPPWLLSEPLSNGHQHHDLQTRPCQHSYLILLCSQKTRDARCGQSAPLLKREFERQLRPLGLLRDPADTRPGGVGIYFISHVGGHKYSANCMIYRKSGTPGTTPAEVQSQANGTVGLNGPHPKENGSAHPHTNGAQDGVDGESNGEAAQCIWLARVRPEDCENIVRYTVLQGKVVKPERQLRGGFDRCQGLTSW